jgi:hypothetical protein
MADIRYVNEGYVDDSYVVITFDTGSVTISGTTSVTASAEKVKSAQSTIQSALANDRSWDEMGTWYEPIQETWEQFSVVEPLVINTATSDNIAVTTALSSSAFRILTIDQLAISADATFTVTAEAQREGETITAFSTTVTSDADVVRTGATTINNTTTTSASAITGYSETLTITTTTSVTADEQLISLPGSDISVVTTTTAQGGRVNPATADIIQTITTTASAGEVGFFGDSDITVTTTMADVASVDILGGVSTIDTQTGIIAISEKVLLPRVTINAFTTTVSVAAGFAIDPYRVYSIDSESRINILQQETRTRLIPSETRTLHVTPGSNTRIIDQAGILDRREG